MGTKIMLKKKEVKKSTDTKKEITEQKNIQKKQ